LVVTLCLVPFLISFERREIDVRTLVLLAVMSALAVVARCLFFWLPSFKPMAAIIMVAGIAMGARSGFACGAASALASNLMFGQGPWTPWQMIAFGLAGFIAGALASTGAFPRFQLTRKQVIALGITGFVVVVFVVGPVLDTSSVFALLSTLKPASILAIYAAGLPFNVIQGTAVSLALLLVANPLLNMIHRVKIRYDLHLYDEKDKHD
jgi:energy-coupling factor transport system substrate-specific component